VTFEQWEGAVPAAIRNDTLWRVEAYRLGLFLSDVSWHDGLKLFKHPLTREVADQLIRATGKISASIAEGYSRDSGKARSIYYQYALGSTREARDWYYKSRRVLTPTVITHRIDLTTQIIRLTLKMVATERRSNRRAST
jgi:four helix bundle protein